MHSATSFTALLVYVDDVIVASTSLDSASALKTFLHAKFRIKDLGSVRYFLGIEVTRSSIGLHLCQRKYALEILADMGSIGSKPLTLPMEHNVYVSSSDGTPFSDSTAYRSLVGRLLYLTITRPNLSYSVQVLSKFLAKPTDVYFTTATRVLCYIRGAVAQGIFFPSTSSCLFSAYCDSNWGVCPNTL